LTNWIETKVQSLGLVNRYSSCNFSKQHVDFFNKRSINYNKRSSSVTSDDLF
jgi:hypothetical protein